MGKKKWIRIGLLSAAVILYAYAAFCCSRAKENADLTYLVLSRKMDADTAEAIFAQEKQLEDPVGFCFWGEKEGQTVLCEQTGSYGQVTQVLVSGNPGLMGAGALAWQKGCLIDEETARTLFGTTDCGGQLLWLEEEPYRVLGTVSAFRPTMLTVAAEKDGQFLDRCVLAIPARRGAAAGEQFMLRWGLQGTRIDFYPAWTLSHNLLLLFPCILLLGAFLSGVKGLKRIPFSVSQLPALSKPVLFLAAVLCLFCFLGSRVIVSPDSIPSRWSDFSFWGSWWEAQKENMQMVLLTPMGERHLQMLLDMVKSMVCSLAALFLSMSAFV